MASAWFQKVQQEDPVPLKDGDMFHTSSGQQEVRVMKSPQLVGVLTVNTCHLPFLAARGRACWEC